MDAWSGDQLRKMQLGGNDALNSFLAKYGVEKDTEIPEKYNSQAAEVQPARPGSPAARGAEPVAPACSRCPCGGRPADARRARPQFYREKIKAEAEGRPYVAPPPSKVAPAPRASGSAAGRAGAGSRQGGWDDWGDERGGGGAGAAPMKVRTEAPLGAARALRRRDRDQQRLPERQRVLALAAGDVRRAEGQLLRAPAGGARVWRRRRTPGQAGC